MRKLLYFFCLGLVACTGSLTAPELSSWLDDEDNGCVQTNPAGEYSLTAQFLPPDYLTYKQFYILEEPYDDSLFDATLTQFEKGTYFKFTIDFSQKPENAKAFFESHQDYMNFYIGEGFSLISAADTVPCSIANMERGANFSPKLNYELAFDYPVENLANPLQLYYEGELSASPIRFTFDKSDLNQTPEIKR